MPLLLPYTPPFAPLLSWLNLPLQVALPNQVLYSSPVEVMDTCHSSLTATIKLVPWLSVT